jgi:hypothetical protein
MFHTTLLARCGVSKFLFIHQSGLCTRYRQANRRASFPTLLSFWSAEIQKHAYMPLLHNIIATVWIYQMIAAVKVLTLLAFGATFPCMFCVHNWNASTTPGFLTKASPPKLFLLPMHRTQDSAYLTSTHTCLRATHMLKHTFKSNPATNPHTYTHPAQTNMLESTPAIKLLTTNSNQCCEILTSCCRLRAEQTCELL